MQAVVGPAYQFLYIFVGWPGSVHDARVFTNSSFYEAGVTLTDRQTFPVHY